MIVVCVQLSGFSLPFLMYLLLRLFNNSSDLHIQLEYYVIILTFLRRRYLQIKAMSDSF